MNVWANKIFAINAEQWHCQSMDVLVFVIV